jgi:hypothetical protein
LQLLDLLAEKLRQPVLTRKLAELLGQIGIERQR